MIDKYKGVAEIEILGEKRGFKFGTAYLAMLCDVEKQSVTEIVKRLDDPGDLAIRLKHYYCAAVQYVKLKNAEEKTSLLEPSFEQVCNWIDSLVDDQKKKIDETAYSQYQDPNVEAPKETGQS